MVEHSHPLAQLVGTILNDSRKEDIAQAVKTVAQFRKDYETTIAKTESNMMVTTACSKISFNNFDKAPSYKHEPAEMIAKFKNSNTPHELVGTFSNPNNVAVVVIWDKGIPRSTSTAAAYAVLREEDGACTIK